MTQEPGSSAAAGVDATLAKSLAGIEIPPRPAIIDQVMAEMQSDEPDYRRLAAMITSDVGLSAWLMRTANAPVFGYRTQARTVRDALTMLGLLMVVRTVAGYAVRQVLPESPALRGFWDTSTRVAHLSAWLAREIGVRDGVRPQDAYTYGLFRDCGIPILMRVNSDYADILAAAMAEPTLPFTGVESARLGLDHAMVGGMMARSWYLPDDYCEAILRHHDSAALGDSRDQASACARRLIAIGQLAEWLQADASGPACNEWAKLGTSALMVLELEAGRPDAMRADAQQILRQLT